MSDVDDEAVQAMRQKLMAADECYLYKIPPLKSAGGHRAEDWDLSKPLQTCSLLVERGGDTLVFSFMAPPGSDTVFAQSVIDISAGQTMQHWLEQVADSSRYYVLKIQSSEGREATIGFGFRDREQGTDLRECLQHYEKSIRREKQAESATATASTFSVPVLKEGEIIHVDRDTGKTSITKTKKSARGGAPMLLKKPPPPSPEAGEKVDVAPAPAAAASPKVVVAAAAAPSSKNDVKEVTTVMGEFDLDGEKADGEEDKDDVQWATEFDIK